MAYSALPTVAEALCIRDLQNACYIVFFYLFFVNMLYYGWFCTELGCGGEVILLVIYRYMSTVLSIIASIALLLGTCYKNWRYLRFAVIMAMIAFALDSFGGFYYLYYVIIHLEDQTCSFYAWFNATFGLILPIVLLYNIIVMHSYRVEMEFILRTPKDQELHVAYY